MTRSAGALLSDETAQSLVEYALLIALVALLTILATRTLGQRVWKYFAYVNDAFDGHWDHWGN